MKNFIVTLFASIIMATSFSAEAQHYRHDRNYEVRQERVFSHYRYREVCQHVRRPYSNNRIHISSSYIGQYGHIDFGISNRHTYRHSPYYNRNHTRSYGIECRIVREPIFTTRTIQYRR